MLSTSVEFCTVVLLLKIQSHGTKLVQRLEMNHQQSFLGCLGFENCKECLFFLSDVLPAVKRSAVSSYRERGQPSLQLSESWCR